MKNSTPDAASRATIATGLLIAVLMAGLIIFLNRGYGKVSHEAYQMATAIYGACLSESEPRIQKIQRLLNQGNETFDMTKISSHEKRWLDDIIQQAHEGQWAEAASAAKQIMEAQNNRKRKLNDRS